MTYNNLESIIEQAYFITFRLIFVVFLILLLKTVYMYRKNIITHLKMNKLVSLVLFSSIISVLVYIFRYAVFGFGHRFGHTIHSIFGLYMGNQPTTLPHHGMTSPAMYSFLQIFGLPFYYVYFLNIIFLIMLALATYSLIILKTKNRFYALGTFVMVIFNPILIRYTPTEIYLNHFIFFTLISLISIDLYFRQKRTFLKIFSLISQVLAFSSGSYGFLSVIVFLSFVFILHSSKARHEITNRKNTKYFLIFLFMCLWQIISIIRRDPSSETIEFGYFMELIWPRMYLFNGLLFESEIFIILIISAIIAFLILSLSSHRFVIIPLFFLITFLITKPIVMLHEAGIYHSIYEMMYSSFWILPVMAILFFFFPMISKNKTQVLMMFLIVLITLSLSMLYVQKDYIEYVHIDAKINYLILDFFEEYTDKVIILAEPEVMPFSLFRIYEYYDDTKKKEAIETFLGKYAETILSSNMTLISYEEYKKKDIRDYDRLVFFKGVDEQNESITDYRKYQEEFSYRFTEKLLVDVHEFGVSGKDIGIRQIINATKEELFSFATTRKHIEGALEFGFYKKP